MSLRNHCLKRSTKDMQFLPINYLGLLNSGIISFGLRFFAKHAALLSFRYGISLPREQRLHFRCVSCRAKVASADNHSNPSRNVDE